MATRLVSLWGDEQQVLGEVADAQLDGSAAVALSRGRFPKSYPHLDPNEDAVLAASGQGGHLLAVADGHSGFDVARAALRSVADNAELLVGATPAKPEEGLEVTCRDAVRAATEVVGAAPRERTDSRTALTIALVVGDRLHVASYGDTACVRIRGAKAKVVGAPGEFLGPGSGRPQIDHARLRSGDRVIVASDGLSDFLGRSWTAIAAEIVSGAPDPLTAVRSLVEQAMDGGAGDHIAVGALL